MLTPSLLEHEPDRALLDLRRKRVCLAHDRILSHKTVSGKPGAVHTIAAFTPLRGTLPAGFPASASHKATKARRPGVYHGKATAPREPRAKPEPVDSRACGVKAQTRRAGWQRTRPARASRKTESEKTRAGGVKAQTRRSVVIHDVPVPHAPRAADWAPIHGRLPALDRRHRLRPARSSRKIRTCGPPGGRRESDPNPVGRSATRPARRVAAKNMRPSESEDACSFAARSRSGWSMARLAAALIAFPDPRARAFTILEIYARIEA